MEEITEGDNGSNNRTATMIFLGLPGAGKSTMIDMLFGKKDVAKDDEFPMEIREYSTEVLLPDEKVSVIKIVDTPGYNQGGLNEENDLVTTLRNLISVEDNSKEFLCVPNIIVIVARFDDNRVEGDSSAFANLLKGFNEFIQDISHDKPKIILALTHFWNVKKEIRKQPETKISVFMKQIEKFTTFSQSVDYLLVENEAEDIGLPEISPGNYVLLDGTVYPQNFFEMVIETYKNCGDEDGQIIFGAASQQALSLSLTLEKHFELIRAGATQTSRKLLEIEDNEINSTLFRVWNNLDDDIKSSEPTYITTLQRNLQSRGLTTFLSLPKSENDTLDFITSLPYHSALSALIENGLQMKMVEFPTDFLLGRGYNILKEKITSPENFVVELLSMKKKLSQLGFILPNKIICDVQNETNTIGNIFDNIDSLVEKRMADLSVTEAISSSKYGEGLSNANLLGYNLRNGNNVAVNKEHRIFKLTLDSVVELNEKFKISVLRILERHTPYSEMEWASFFEMYGTHVIYSVAGGGFIRTTVKGPRLDQLDDKFLGKIVDVSTKQATPDFDNRGLTYNTQIYGGVKNRLENFEASKLSAEEIGKNMDEWRKSLSKSPVMLPTHMKLAPLSFYARQVSVEVGLQMEAAIRKYLGDFPSRSSAAGACNYGVQTTGGNTSVSPKGPTNQNTLQTPHFNQTSIIPSGAYHAYGSSAQTSNSSSQINMDKSKSRGVESQYSNSVRGFRKGSQVLLKGNRWVPIEDLRCGDVVLGKNFDEGVISGITSNLCSTGGLFGFANVDPFFTTGILFEADIGNIYEAKYMLGKKEAVAVGRTVERQTSTVGILKLVPYGKEVRPEHSTVTFQKTDSKMKICLWDIEVKTLSDTFIVNGFVFHNPTK